MQVPAMTEPMAVAPPSARRAAATPRNLLVVLTAIAVAGAGIAASRAPTAAIEPDLARVIRCMALIKGSFALAAFAGCLWRLGRPAAAWRTIVYVAGPPLMAAGAIGLWSLQGLGAAALGLHLGLFAVLAAALTDPDVFSGWPHGKPAAGIRHRNGYPIPDKAGSRQRVHASDRI